MDVDETLTEDHDEIIKLLDDEILKEGDFLLVQFPTKKTIRFCVGLILETDESCNEYLVKFYRKKGQGGFCLPDVEDVSRISRNDIVSRLPKPLEIKGTSRTKSIIHFQVKFDTYNMI